MKLNRLAPHPTAVPAREIADATVGELGSADEAIDRSTERALAPGAARSVVGRAKAASPESLIGLRASARLPRFTPSLDLQLAPGERVVAGCEYRIAGDTNTYGSRTVVITGISAEALLLEDLHTTTVGDFEDVVLEKTVTGAYVGRARSGEWHLLPEDRVGVRRLCYVPIDSAAHYIDLKMTRLELGKDLRQLDGVRLQAATADGKALSLAASVDGDFVIFAGKDGSRWTFDGGSAQAGLGFSAKESGLFQRATLGFDCSSGEYRLAIHDGAEAYHARVSLPLRKARPPERFRCVHGSSSGAHDVTLAESLSLADGRTALRFATAPRRGLPTLVYLDGEHGVDAAGLPVSVNRHGKHMTLTLDRGRVVIELEFMRREHDLERFAGKHAEIDILGPIAHDESGQPRPEVGQTRLVLTFAASSRAQTTTVQVESPGEEPCEATVYADDLGGFTFQTHWAKYRMTPRTDGSFDLASSWWSGSVRGEAVATLTH